MDPTDPLNPESPIDQGWQTRIPQGWIRFPDGSIGPPNPVGGDWNAPFRQSPTSGGMGFPAQGNLPINQPGTPPGVGGTVGYNGPPLSPRASAPSMNLGGGAPGTSLTTTNPPPATRTPPLEGEVEGGGPLSRLTNGPRVNPSEFSGGGGILSALSRGGLWGLGGYLMGKTIEPQPAETGEFTPAEPNFVRPDAPQGNRGLPAPPSAPTQPARPVTPTPSTAYPPSGGGKKGRINPATVNLGRGAPIAAPDDSNLIDRPNMSAAGWNPGAPKMTAGNLSGLFSGLFNHPAVAAAAAAHPNVQARVAGPLAANPPIPPKRPLPEVVAGQTRMTAPYTYLTS